MKPVVAANFNQLDGACDYFNLLESDNERIKKKTNDIATVNMESKQAGSLSATVASRNMRLDGALREIEREPATANQGERAADASDNSAAASSSGQSELHSLPRGYP